METINSTVVAHLTKPEENEFALILLGPGVGEGILVHLGGGTWIVVDSCLDAGEPAALRVLRAFGVDPETAIKLVVASHWHTDHIRGLSDIVRVATSASFAFSAAFQRDELRGLLCDAADVTGRIGLAGTEFGTALAHVYERRTGGARARFEVAKEGSILFGIETPAGDAVVTALSPSSAAILRRSTDLLSETGGRRVALPRHSGENHCAIALHVKVGRIGAILGSDLETHEDADSGWRAVVGAWSDLEERCPVLKVPHHGSGSSYASGLWKRVLVPEPVAVLSPNRSVRTPLPTSADRERLLAMTTSSFITCDPKRPRSTLPKGRARAYAKERLLGCTLRKCGAIAVRGASPSEMQVELIPPAKLLASARV